MKHADTPPASSSPLPPRHTNYSLSRRMVRGAHMSVRIGIAAIGASFWLILLALFFTSVGKPAPAATALHPPPPITINPLNRLLANTSSRVSRNIAVRSASTAIAQQLSPTALPSSIHLPMLVSLYVELSSQEIRANLASFSEVEEQPRSPGDMPPPMQTTSTSIAFPDSTPTAVSAEGAVSPVIVAVSPTLTEPALPTETPALPLITPMPTPTLTLTPTLTGTPDILVPLLRRDARN